MLARAAFTVTLLSLTGMALGQAAAPEARIKIDVDRVIGEVDPLLFGNFAEHLGRMIYGGNFCSGYDWQDGIGPRDERRVRAELAWNALESNRFGTDEFLRYAEMIGAEPYLCVNLGLGSIDDAPTAATSPGE